MEYASHARIWDKIMHTPFHNQIETTVNVETTSREVRTGVTTSVVEEFSETRADRVVSTNIAQSMRSRDITVTGENFKPTTKYYVFFDGIDVNAHMTPTSATYGVADGTAKGTGLRSLIPRVSTECIDLLNKLLSYSPE